MLFKCLFPIITFRLSTFGYVARFISSPLPSSFFLLSFFTLPHFRCVAFVVVSGFFKQAHKHHLQWEQVEAGGPLFGALSQSLQALRIYTAVILKFVGPWSPWSPPPKKKKKKLAWGPKQLPSSPGAALNWQSYEKIRSNYHFG